MGEPNNIEIFHVLINHATANPLERKNQDLKKVMRTLLVDQQKCSWQKQISKALFILRTRKNAATNMTPSMALLGYELPLPRDWKLPKSLYSLSKIIPHLKVDK
ncbi:hypothetical protein JTB14_002115 [Gonioctena quinquepunctata]|nr:hypothetical protein JTB14_002115 [Gonioctena quinquepunctata]